MIAIDFNPSPRSLRLFAAVWFPLFAITVGAIVGTSLGSWNSVCIAWGICGAVAGLGTVRPKFIGPVYVGLMLLTYPIGFVVSHALLCLIFLLIVTPIGVCRRLLGADPLALRRHMNRTTMWHTSTATRPTATYPRLY